jgi:alpha-tubulin suppressor-like RCC1 family protein
MRSAKYPRIQWPFLRTMFVFIAIACTSTWGNQAYAGHVGGQSFGADGVVRVICDYYAGIPCNHNSSWLHGKLYYSDGTTADLVSPTPPPTPCNSHYFAHIAGPFDAPPGKTIIKIELISDNPALDAVIVTNVIDFIPCTTAYDTDNDGLNNLQEKNTRTDYFKPDSDDDGMGDLWEVTYGMNPWSSTGLESPQMDRDNDGYANLMECNANTDPKNAASTPISTLVIDQVTPSEAEPGVIEEGSLEFTAQAHDTEGNVVVYDWFVDNIEMLSSMDGSWVFHPSIDDGGLPPLGQVHEVKCLVKSFDGSYLDGQYAHTWRVHVQNKNHPPFIFVDDLMVEAYQDVMLDYSVDDPDNDNDSSVDDNELTVTISGWMNSVFKKTTSSDVGQHTVTLTVTDNGQPPLSHEKQITVNVMAINDRDNDGMPDSWEQDFGFDPDNPVDAAGDKDNDGLMNLDEFRNHTDPDDPDTDDDNMPDKWEIDNGLNPLVNDAVNDLDGDGIQNLKEYNFLTRANDSDTDDDDLTDKEELLDKVYRFNSHSLSMAQKYVVMLTDVGTVKAWGSAVESSGSAPVTTVQKASGGDLTGVKAVAARNDYGVAVLENGTVVEWARGGTASAKNGPDGSLLSGVVKVAAGWNNSLALLENGEVVAWGDNNCGQLGQNNTTPSASPVYVKNTSGMSRLTGIQDIDVGYCFALALDREGRVWGWGMNHLYQLGQGSGSTSINLPVQIPMPGGMKATKISGRGNHGMALLEDGTVAAWGWNDHAQIGNDTQTSNNGGVPSAVRAIFPVGTPKIVDIAAAGYQSLAVDETGKVWYWGRSDFGGSTVVKKPAARGLENGWIVYGGFQGHAAVRISDGQLYTWGNNRFGVLGMGTVNDVNYNTPQERAGLRMKVLRTDPTNDDTDNDELKDGWEVEHGLDPLNPQGLNGSNGDPDQDGFSNLQESNASTDPRDPNSTPPVLVITESTPPGTTTGVSEGEYQDFQVTVVNNLGQAINYTWHKDVAVIQGQTQSSWRFEPDYNAAGNEASKNFTIRVVAQSGANEISKQWTITVNNRCIIQAQAGLHGTVTPASQIVEYGHDAAFTIQADAHYHIEGILNHSGEQVGQAYQGQGSANFAWPNCTADEQLSVVFAENMTEHGVPETWLAAHGLTDELSDTDSDGLPAWQEYVAGTSPADNDSDNDRLKDGWEVAHELNPLDRQGDDGAQGDPDGDELTNIEEFQYGTHPRQKDTDSDGIWDGQELVYNKNPLHKDEHFGPDWYVANLPGGWAPDNYEDQERGGGNGSPSAPFRTVQAAVDAIEAIQNRTVPHIIHIARGEYFGPVRIHQSDIQLIGEESMYENGKLNPASVTLSLVNGNLEIEPGVLRPVSVYVENADRIVIKNMFIDAWPYDVESPDDEAAAGYGIVMKGGMGSTIENVIVSGLLGGILFAPYEEGNSTFPTRDGTIRHSTIHGIRLNGALNCEVIDCSINSPTSGIHMDGALNCHIQYNRIGPCTGSGILIENGSGGHLIEQNNIGMLNAHNRCGITIQDTSIGGTRILNNDIYYNTQLGVDVAGNAVFGAIAHNNIEHNADPNEFNLRVHGSVARGSLPADEPLGIFDNWFGSPRVQDVVSSVEVRSDLTWVPLAGAPVHHVLTFPQPIVLLNPIGTKSGDVQFSYVLIHPESKPCQVKVEYSCDGGSSFYPTTMGVGGDGNMSLSSSPSGQWHHYVWNSMEDVLGERTIILRMRAFDGEVYGDWVQTQPFTLQNNVDNLMAYLGIDSGDLSNGQILYLPDGRVVFQYYWAGAGGQPVLYSTSPSHVSDIAFDNEIDSDQDGLTGMQEYNAGTHPFKADTDDDGVNDAVELTEGSNPVDPDSDDDLLTDGYELNVLGSDSLDAASGKELIRPPRQVAAGGRHSVVLKDDGTVWTWGDNGLGQLGDGTTNQSLEARQVQNLPLIQQVDAELYGSLALSQDGRVYAWGGNEFEDFGLLPAGTRFTLPYLYTNLPVLTQISMGAYVHYGLTAEGLVWAWGHDEHGALGDGQNNWNRRGPVQTSNLTDVVKVEAGAKFGVAVKRDGTVWTWGWNKYGQLGIGSTNTQTMPVQVPGLNGIVNVSVYANHVIALKGDGTVWTWGQNIFGQCGVDHTNDCLSPQQVPNLSEVVAVQAGSDHALALKADGTVWAWGRNWEGQLGKGTYTHSRVPVQVSNLTDALALGAGGCHSLAIKQNGDVVGWGENRMRQLGDGTLQIRNLPVWAGQMNLGQ